MTYDGKLPPEAPPTPELRRSSTPRPVASERPVLTGDDLRRLIRNIPGLRSTSDAYAMRLHADALDALTRAVEQRDAAWTAWCACSGVCVDQEAAYRHALGDVEAAIRQLTGGRAE